jgi:hypothetical protein
MKNVRTHHLRLAVVLVEIQLLVGKVVKAPSSLSDTPTLAEDIVYSCVRESFVQQTLRKW